MQRDPHNPLFGPTAPGYDFRMPGYESPADRRRPGLDERLVTPETTRDEMVRGRKLMAFPANPPHATRHAGLDFVVAGNVARGYEPAVEMLTRIGPGSDFAADVAVKREGTDPATGERYLEELVFEVVSEQSLRDITARAEDLTNRGVRRVIAIFIKLAEVREWDRARNYWRILPLDDDFTDPTLVRSFKVRALLDSAAGEDAVAEGLDAKCNPALLRIKAAERAEGRAEGAVDALVRMTLPLLKKQGLEPSREQRMTIVACRDQARLERWLDRVAEVASVAELLTIE